ncbi:uncharacterized protein F4807DRAFT_65623 [Annulohypoxylon truncatum]|uniref:uncharacterized protein n=1 Tax=Annulohypoxylon truncatum TaxID=327061 RepID=UPI00200839B6|nr:uncharacterized protein F4807DRAFT_65623 [Annulohypoxylon truncatum]KAI1210421.1 hypothetical protein F4807DRAFT_65623 [Annulohypoxylon truncatum]
MISRKRMWKDTIKNGTSPVNNPKKKGGEKEGSRFGCLRPPLSRPVPQNRQHPPVIDSCYHFFLFPLFLFLCLCFLSFFFFKIFLVLSSIHEYILFWLYDLIIPNPFLRKNKKRCSLRVPMQRLKFLLFCFFRRRKARVAAVTFFVSRKKGG